MQSQLRWNGSFNEKAFKVARFAEPPKIAEWQDPVFMFRSGQSSNTNITQANWDSIPHDALPTYRKKVEDSRRPFPFVLETADHKKFEGRREDTTDSAFVLFKSEMDVDAMGREVSYYNVIPCEGFYKFRQAPTWKILTEEEAEKMYSTQAHMQEKALNSVKKHQKSESEIKLEDQEKKVKKEKDDDQSLEDFYHDVDISDEGDIHDVDNTEQVGAFNNKEERKRVTLSEQGKQLQKLRGKHEQVEGDIESEESETDEELLELTTKTVKKELAEPKDGKGAQNKKKRKKGTNADAEQEAPPQKKIKTEAPTLQPTNEALAQEQEFESQIRQHLLIREKTYLKDLIKKFKVQIANIPDGKRKFTDILGRVASTDKDSSGQVYCVLKEDANRNYR